MTINSVQWSQGYGYDNGAFGSVGINDAGLMIEMHQGPLSGNDENLYYRLGWYGTTPGPNLTSPIAWGGPAFYTNGSNPSVDINGQYAIEVHQDANENLYSCVGTLSSATAPALPTVAWGQVQQYTTGLNPAVAINNQSCFVEVHESSDFLSTALWYRVGYVNGGVATAGPLILVGSGASGQFIQVALNDSGVVLLAYRGGLLFKSTICQLTLLAGVVNGNAIAFGSPVSTLAVTLGDSFDVALANDGSFLVTLSTSGVAGSYLGWIAGSVNNSAITLPQQMPLSIIYGGTGVGITMAMNNQGQIIQEDEINAATGDMEHRVAAAQFTTDYSGWMGANLPSIGNIPLYHLSIPGTHDSGTYDVSPSSALSPDRPSWALNLVPGAVLANWAMAQPMNFLQQLNAGIRYLDLRISHRTSDDTFWFVHSVYSAPLSDLFTQLQQFYAQPQSANEVVLLDMNHFYSDGPANPDMDPAELQELASMINTQIGSQLLPPSIMGQSLNQILNPPAGGSKGRLILFFDDVATVAANPAYWPNVSSQQPRPLILSPYPNVQDLPSLVTDLSGYLTTVSNIWTGAAGAQPAFFVLQCIATETTGMVAAGVVHAGPPSLQTFEAQICSPSLFWLAGQPGVINSNVILVDWLPQTTVVPLCMALNKQKGGLSATGG